MKEENKGNEKEEDVSTGSPQRSNWWKLLRSQFISCFIIYSSSSFLFTLILYFFFNYSPKYRPICTNDIYVVHVLIFLANFWLIVILPSFTWFSKRCSFISTPTLLAFLKSESSLKTGNFPYHGDGTEWNTKDKQKIYINKIVSINTTQGIFALVTTVMIILVIQVPSDTGFHDLLKYLILSFSLIVIGVQLYLAEVMDTSANIFQKNSIEYQAFFYRKVWITYISYAFFSLLFSAFFLFKAPSIMMYLIPFLLTCLGYTYFIANYEYREYYREFSTKKCKEIVLNTKKTFWTCPRFWGAVIATLPLCYSLMIWFPFSSKYFSPNEIVKAGDVLETFLESATYGETKKIKDNVTSSDLFVSYEIAVEGLLINQKLIRIRESKLKKDNLKIAVIQGKDDKKNVIALKSVYLLKNEEGVYKVMVNPLPGHTRFMFSYPPVEDIENIDWRNREEIEELLWLLNVLNNNEVNLEKYREKLEALLKNDTKHLIKGWIHLSIAAIYLWSGKEVEGKQYFYSGFEHIPNKDKNFLREIVNDNEIFKWSHKVKLSPELDITHIWKTYRL
jgi:hypothetical protein